MCLTADGPISLEMERYFKAIGRGNAYMTARRVLEINPNASVFRALSDAVKNDREKAVTLTEILYSQAMLIAGFPLDDPSAYSDMVCSLL